VGDDDVRAPVTADADLVRGVEGHRGAVFELLDGQLGRCIPLHCHETAAIASRYRA
jgi:hypothetical protein